MRDSRLTRKSIDNSKHSLYISLVGIIIVMVIAFNFGPLFITSLGSFIDNVTGKGNQTTNLSSNSDLEPPSLDSLPEAVKDGKIDISGRSSYNNGQIDLVVNGEKIDSVELNNAQNFSFEGVQLSDGDNFIKVRTVLNGKRSGYSEEEKVIFNKKEPKLEVSNPSDKQSFSKADREINVSGITDPENTVNVNDFVAIVDSSGNFTYTYHLNTGDNKITIKAKSPAGQETTKELTVSYSE